MGLSSVLVITTTTADCLLRHHTSLLTSRCSASNLYMKWSEKMVKVTFFNLYHYIQIFLSRLLTSEQNINPSHMHLKMVSDKRKH